MVKSADVVIIGAGIAGLSVAKSLIEDAKLNVIVVDMEPTYACGATGRAAGSVRRQLHTESLTRFADESTNCIITLGKLYDIDLLCESPGYLNLTGSTQWKERLIKEDEIHKKVGLKTEILSPEEIERKWNFINTRDLLLGTFSPEDINVDPYEVASAFFKSARAGGCRFEFSSPVRGFLKDKRGRVCGVKTDRGNIPAGVVVNAAGPWAAKLCIEAGTTYKPPMIPKRRHIWQVRGKTGIPSQIPFIVDLDSQFYIRPYRGIFLLSLMDEGEIELTGNEPPFDWELIFSIEEKVSFRIPSIIQAEVAKGWAGWRTITPDDMPVLGEVDEVPGLFVCAGFGGHGLALAPAAGKLVASAITGKTDSKNKLIEFSISRFKKQEI